MRLELPRIFRKFESTVLYVTQDYKEALALGDRIGVLLEGRFEQLDTPEGIYRTPRNRRVANLFGDPPINLFPIRPAHAGDGALQAVIGGQPVALGEARGRLDGRECVLGVRPEDVALSFEPVSNGIPVVLEAVTPFNVRTVTLLKTPDATEILASQPEDNSLAMARGHREGWASIDLDRAMFFDAKTGARL
jgi:multiple sugar transport system ATP-binding protein